MKKNIFRNQLVLSSTLASAVILECCSSKKKIGQEPTNEKLALSPKVGRLSADMLGFDGALKDVVILNKEGKPLMAGDHDKRFFEASWMHKYNGRYYFSYSTGDTHNIAYAIGNSPMGSVYLPGYNIKPGARLDQSSQHC